jgi:DNA repair exonuclease SbcCD nuclease subunit
MTQKQLKIIFFADSHLGFDFPLRPRLKIRRRGPDFFKNFDKILAYAEKTRPDLLIHGGDLFFRSRVPELIVEKVYRTLFDFVNRTGIAFFIVPGNHERSRLPQSIYLAHPLIHVFNRARYFLLRKENLCITLHGFPFYPGDIRSSFKDILKQCGWDRGASLRLLILHQAIDGARVGPANYTFRKRKDVINIQDIPENASAVLCGHIHRRQILYARNVPVIYPGSIERTSFAEKGEDKGFFEINFSKHTGHSGKWIIEKLKFIQLPARPMIDIYLPDVTSQEAITQSLKKQFSSLPEDAVIRLCPAKGNNNDFPENLSLIRHLLPNTFSLQMTQVIPTTLRKKQIHINNQKKVV